MILEQIEAALKLLNQLGYQWDEDQRAWLGADGMLVLDSDVKYLQAVTAANGVTMETTP